MKSNIYIIIIAVLTFMGCSKPVVEKPENLIGESKMVEVLVDVHLAEAAFNTRRHRDSLLTNSSSANFYHSALQKHNLQDSIFEKSFVYYASQPKSFEKMYRQVMNSLTEMEQEYSGRKIEMQELDIQKRRQ